MLESVLEAIHQVVGSVQQHPIGLHGPISVALGLGYVRTLDSAG